MDEGSDGGVLLLSPVKFGLVAIGLLVVAAIVFGTAAATGLLGLPEIADVDNSFGDVDESVTMVHTNVTVRNPNPVGVSIESVDVAHTVEMNGIEMGRGVREGLSVPAGTSAVRVETALRNDRVPDWWVSHVRRGERTNLTVEASVAGGPLGQRVSPTVASRTVRTNVLGAFETDRTIPVNASYPGVSDPVLYVNETSARWATVTDERTVVAVTLTVTNPKAIAIPIENVTYDVTMNDVAVANGSTANVTPIPANSRANVTARLAIDNSKLDEWWVSHVERNQTTRVTFDYAVELNLTAFGRGTRTFSPDPVNRTVRTDIFRRSGEANNGGLAFD